MDLFHASDAELCHGHFPSHFIECMFCYQGKDRLGFPSVDLVPGHQYP